MRGPSPAEVVACRGHDYPNYCDCAVHDLMVAAAIRGLETYVNDPVRGATREQLLDLAETIAGDQMLQDYHCERTHK